MTPEAQRKRRSARPARPERVKARGAAPLLRQARCGMPHAAWGPAAAWHSPPGRVRRTHLVRRRVVGVVHQREHMQRSHRSRGRGVRRQAQQQAGVARARQRRRPGEERRGTRRNRRRRRGQRHAELRARRTRQPRRAAGRGRCRKHGKGVGSGAELAKASARKRDIVPAQSRASQPPRASGSACAARADVRGMTRGARYTRRGARALKLPWLARLLCRPAARSWRPLPPPARFQAGCPPCAGTPAWC